MALAIWATLPFSEPVHCGSGTPSNAAASASPDRVGTKNEFVVTWLTKTNRHPGVLGKGPDLPPFWDCWTPLQAASRVLAAIVAPPAPRYFSALLREVAFVSAIIVTPQSSQRQYSGYDGSPTVQLGGP
jgi:hypothetical protein